MQNLNCRPKNEAYFLLQFTFFNFDDLVKSLKIPFPVIPAKAGIQFFQIVINSLDSGFHRSDNFLRIHHF